MPETMTIFFAPFSINVQNKADATIWQGLLQIFAMNLQTYPGIDVQAPLFLIDAAQHPPNLPHRKKKNTAIEPEWEEESVPEENLEQDLLEMFKEAEIDVQYLLSPMVKEVPGESPSRNFSFEVKLLQVTGDFTVYEQEWQGSLTQILEKISYATHIIAIKAGAQGIGSEKWPVSQNEEALSFFLKGIAVATYFQAGIGKTDFQFVIRTLLRAFELDPSLVLAPCNLVEFLANLLSNPYLPVRIYRQGINLIKKLEKDPDLPGIVHIFIAQIYKDLGNTNQVKKNLEKAISKAPEDKDVVVDIGSYYEDKNLWGKAKVIYENYLNMCPAIPSHVVVHNLATVHAEEGNLDKAIELWCYCLRLEPNCGSAYGNLMNAYMEQKEFGKMWVVFEEGLKRIPVSWPSYEHLFRNVDQISDFTPGVQALEDYIANHPEERAGYFHLGFVLYQLEAYPKAVEILEQGLEKCTGPQFFNDLQRLLLSIKVGNFEKRLAHSYKDVLHGRPAKAIPFLQECNQQVKSFWPTWFLLGKAYQELHQYPKALKALKRAHHLVPNHSDVLNELGILATLTNKHKYALKCFHKAVSLDPFHPDYLCNLALESLKGGEYKKASQIIQRVLSMRPHNKVAHNILSILEGKNFTKHSHARIPPAGRRKKNGNKE